MTPHLSPEEFVQAVEAALDSSRAAHLDACASCAAEGSTLRSTLAEIEIAKAVPEPSPLFWDHLSDRIRIAAATAPEPTSWWTRVTWRPLAVASVAAVVIAMVAVWPSTPEPGVSMGTVTEVAPADAWLPALEDGSFDIVLDLASELDWDDVRQVASPRAGTVDALIQELSPAEREQLVQLLKSEIGALE